MKPVVQVTRISDDITDAVAGFFRKVWTDDATGERLRHGRAEAARLNPSAPGTDIPAVVYLRDEAVIGHLGTVPVKFWNRRLETPAHWLKGLMVLPEHQNGPVGFALLKEMLKHVDVSGAMVIALPARRLFQAVGFVDCGAIPNHVCVLRASSVARSIDIAKLGLGLPTWLHRCAYAAQKSGLAWGAGTLTGAGFRAWRALRTPSLRLFTDLSGQLPTRRALDELWSRARPTIIAGAVRDGTFLSWRYHAGAGRAYEAVSIYEREDKKRLVAIAVLRRWSDKSDERLSGIRVATLADIVFRVDEPAAGIAALEGAERAAERMGADAILCSTAHPAITSALRRRAYTRLPGNLHFMLRDRNKSTGLPLVVDAWWLMRGDANSDEPL